MANKKFPIIQEIDYLNPITLFACFAHDDWALLLDSADSHQPYELTNRYSYIATSPFATLCIKNGKLDFTSNPFKKLREYLQHFQLPTREDLPPFQGGIAGYFAYDLLQYLESVPSAPDDMQFPDLAVGMYDTVISFDHAKKRAWIISSGFPENQTKKRRSRALKRIEEITAVITREQTLSKPKKIQVAPNEIHSEFTPDEYMEAVRKCKQYIRDGDIFEVNLSQRFKTTLPTSVSTFDLYRHLRKVNPTPFSAFFRFNDVAIASASPERFLLLQKGKVEARPIKGTARRGNDQKEDQAIAKTLMNSNKDRSENVMIVDLMRNDLSRVCKPDSIKVEKLCGLETFPNVHHLVSVVTGILDSNKGPIELLEASFPGGSITGAPKIRAMEIIAEMERNARGPYCGSIGFIGFNGSLDLSIVIRTFCIKEDTVTFQVGGAIVLDSDPKSEYEETLDKASGLLKALTTETVEDRV